MFGFKKKDKPPKDTNSPEFRLYMCKKLDGMSLKYVLERDPEKGDRVIVTRSERTLELIKLKKDAFYETLYNKMS